MTFFKRYGRSYRYNFFYLEHYGLNIESLNIFLSQHLTQILHTDRLQTVQKQLEPHLMSLTNLTILSDDLRFFVEFE